MKFRTTISILAASILALTSLASFAGQGQGQGGASADRMQQVDRDRGFDRDRTIDRDRTQDRDRIQDPAQDRDPIQDRQRIHAPSELGNQDIYGNEFMTPAECDLYREELGLAHTQRSGEQFQARHEEQMQSRALQQGQDLVPPGQGKVYGGEFMSVQERNEYREQLRLMDSDLERDQLQIQHRKHIQQRANALGLEVEEAE
jgi:hypothetical protein